MYLARLLTCLPMLAAFAAAPAVSGEDKVTAVVELFTSQGCSSCPAADALIGQYRKRPGIMALSMPVDYWDYLGWKDTLANPSFSKRQRDYAAARKDNHVYTPQVVVNGRIHTKGNNMPAIEKALETARMPGEGAVQITAERTGAELIIEIGNRAGGGQATSGTVWLATVKPEVPVTIRQGENRGRTITYFNVVRSLSPIGTWSGEPTKLKLPHAELVDKDERCAVFVQLGHSGPIVTAAWMKARE